MDKGSVGNNHDYRMGGPGKRNTNLSMPETDDSNNKKDDKKARHPEIAGTNNNYPRSGMFVLRILPEKPNIKKIHSRESGNPV